MGTEQEIRDRLDGGTEMPCATEDLEWCLEEIARLRIDLEATEMLLHVNHVNAEHVINRITDSRSTAKEVKRLIAELDEAKLRNDRLHDDMEAMYENWKERHTYVPAGAERAIMEAMEAVDGEDES